MRMRKKKYLEERLSLCDNLIAPVVEEKDYRKANEQKEYIDLEVVKKALDRLKISANGLDNTDIDYLMSIVKKFGGGPVGIESIASSIGEEATTIEDVIEPFLLQEGYIKRTSRGRVVTEKTYREFKINEQKTLFDFE